MYRSLVKIRSVTSEIIDVEKKKEKEKTAAVKYKPV